ncbi:Golgi-associated plant pathogenesis-related protein 1-like protein [Leptotrombidium deliense]|uniref:Golgi-associated plant pathogenesis-related protein 1-like protein n=1 Tax=Leptotrombidium deliense TaxID=299467 RepID=A0A443SP92_9ACAR|nr:Golgi-associated plant pathogenesis-related protein 1-like protein [Leptotrombidium deliense]
MYSLFLALCLFTVTSAKTSDKTDLLFLSDCLSQHNYYRNIHSAENVGYEVDLIRLAQSKAESFAIGNATDVEDEKYGMNSAWNPGTDAVNCRSVVDVWYRELKYYNHKKAAYKNHAPHFTQLIWKSTKNIGCAQVSTKSPTPAPIDEHNFLSQCLYQHNYYRNIHGSSNVAYTDNLNQMAANIVKIMVDSEITDFDDRLVDDHNYGINTLWSPNREQVSCQSVVDQWYNEKKFYRYKASNNAPHFTQLIWKVTENIGCAQSFAELPTHGVYTVCVYYPRGNIKSRYLYNVIV